MSARCYMWQSKSKCGKMSQTLLTNGRGKWLWGSVIQYDLDRLPLGRKPPCAYAWFTFQVISAETAGH